MTASHTPDNVFSGHLSNLMLDEAVTTGILRHTLHGKAVMTPVRIPAEAKSLLGLLVEGPVTLFGDLVGGFLHVTGPAESYILSGEIIDLDDHTCEVTGETVLKGEIRMESDDSVYPFIVRKPEWIELLQESFDPFGLNNVDFVAVARGEVFEVTQMPDQAQVTAMKQASAKLDALEQCNADREAIWNAATAGTLH